MMEGIVWKLGDNIDTDLIVPGQYLDAPIEEATRHVFESIKPGFSSRVKQGDIIIGGKNFGCGSSRENAPAAIKKLGIACIAAESFARIFFRNAIAIGLPVVICRDISTHFSEGDRARISFRAALIENLETGSKIQGKPFPDEILALLEKGGIMEMLKADGKKQGNPEA
jgi:3-isopropylmalate/(R)-2-methylmalate dehydratase small subunit